MAFLTPDPRHLDRSDARPERRSTSLPADALYRARDGSQDLPDLTADELVDALSDEVLEHGDVEEALRQLMQRGLRSDDPEGRPPRSARPPRPAARPAARGVSRAASPTRLRTSARSCARSSTRNVPRSSDGSTRASRARKARTAAHLTRSSRAMLRSIAAKRLDSLDSLPPTSARGSARSRTTTS
jgi:hypothetical protein